MPSTGEQRSADLGLDALEPAAERWLRDVQLPRRGGEGTGAANGHHELEIAPIHTATVTNVGLAYSERDGDARGSDRGHGAYTDRQAQGGTGRMASVRPPRVHVAGSRDAHRY